MSVWARRQPSLNPYSISGQSANVSGVRNMDILFIICRRIEGIRYLTGIQCMVGRSNGFSHRTSWTPIYLHFSRLHNTLRCCGCLGLRVGGPKVFCGGAGCAVGRAHPCAPAAGATEERGRWHRRHIRGNVCKGPKSGTGGWPEAAIYSNKLDVVVVIK